MDWNNWRKKQLGKKRKGNCQQRGKEPSPNRIGWVTIMMSGSGWLVDLMAALHAGYNASSADVPRSGPRNISNRAKMFIQYIFIENKNEFPFLIIWKFWYFKNYSFLSLKAGLAYQGLGNNRLFKCLIDFQFRFHIKVLRVKTLPKILSQVVNEASGSPTIKDISFLYRYGIINRCIRSTVSHQFTLLIIIINKASIIIIHCIYLFLIRFCFFSVCFILIFLYIPSEKQ